MLYKTNKQTNSTLQSQISALPVLLKHPETPRLRGERTFSGKLKFNPLPVCLHCSGSRFCVLSLGDHSALACTPRDWDIFKSLYDPRRNDLFFGAIKRRAWVQWLPSSELKSSHDLAYSLSLGPSVMAFHLIQYAPNWVLVISNEFSLLIDILYLVVCLLFSVPCQ